MRKIVYLLLLPLMFAATMVQAQTFTMQKDTATGIVSAYADVYNYINNSTSGIISVDWRIIGHNLPMNWVDSAKFGLCDNVTCYDTGVLNQGNIVTTDTFGPGRKCLFKLQMDASSSNLAPAGPFYISCELTSGSTTDTVTFIVQKFATSVQKLSSAAREDVTLYPNPAFGEVNVTFSKEANIKHIAIYNLVGKQVASFRNSSSTSAKLDIEKIPSGIYFVRLMDGSGRVVATRRFTHQ